MSELRTYTQEELQALCREWQERLRLMDWDVDITYARQRDMPIPDVQGSCHWTISKKQAVIRILDPIDYHPDAVWPQDVERTTVHELIHLHFAPFFGENNPDSLEHIAKEQAIDLLAGALVAVKRTT